MPTLRLRPILQQSRSSEWVNAVDLSKISRTQSRAIRTHTTHSSWVSVANAVFQRLDSRWKDGRLFCLTIGEVNVGLEAVQLDQLPVADGLKLMQDESVCNADGENDSSPLISYVDNSTETNPTLKNLAKNSPQEVNVNELGAQDT